MNGNKICGLSVALINFNTSDLTRRCIESLIATPGVGLIWVLENGSTPHEATLLSKSTEPMETRVRLVQAEHNLGFAAGCNLLVDRALGEGDAEHVLLLNNDAVALPGLVQSLLRFSAEFASLHLVGGRVHRMAEPEVPDSLGITLYSCLIASNRQSLNDPYLGPTGACMLMSRSFINDVVATTGHLFDPDFFCYWEDTDLVIRGRLLGYEPDYCDDLVALHEGQASSGGRLNPFIAYHGLRNAIWTFVKCMPWPVILLRGPHFLLANLLSILRFMVTGQWRLMYRIYRDAFLGVPRCLRQRKRIIAARRIPSAKLLEVISPKFYETGYIPAAVIKMFSRKNRSRDAQCGEGQ